MLIGTVVSTRTISRMILIAGIQSIMASGINVPTVTLVS